MPKKKSGKLVAQRFQQRIVNIENYCDAIDRAGLGKADVSTSYDGAIIKLAVSFEEAMLDSLVVATNNNTTHISKSFDIEFPQHLSDEVCEYLVTGGEYVDFHGRSGLIKVLKRFLPSDHYLVTVVKKERYRQSLDRLIALRNFAAHESAQSKSAVKKQLGLSRIESAGAWLKRQGRFKELSGKLKALAGDLEHQAHY